MTSFAIQSPEGSFETVIGLEIHAQIVSQSKLFSGSPSQVFGKDPNSCVSFLDIAMPGMLPTLNQECVDQAIRLGLAINGTIRLVSHMDRKHYFYPDSPAGYQISQYQHPVVEDGELAIQGPEHTWKTIRIQRIHIEQDAGKTIHDRDPHQSYVDFNRAGVGLMEIVTHPDLSSPEEVIDYVKRVRCLMRYLGVCHGDMEKGQLRVDANVSVRKPGEPLGTRVELKNMNSLKFLQNALYYEIDRQIQELSQGRQLIQETRTYDVASGKTRTMRTKEIADDYFYFPDPDLLPIVLSTDHVNALAKALPETPWAKHARFVNSYGLSDYDANLLVEDMDVAAFFEETVTHLSDPAWAKLAANWILGEFFGMLKRTQTGFLQSRITTKHLAELVTCVATKQLSNLLAKEVFSFMFETGHAPTVIMDQKGLTQVSDQSQVQTWISCVLQREKDNLAAYLSGKDKLFAFFVGQVMKESKGKANPQFIQELLEKSLAALRTQGTAALSIDTE
jgi:aspartyl-tRNA(Asn)/glutamyl-tRNA(Gln) amidotransferase subunit B